MRSIILFLFIQCFVINGVFAVGTFQVHSIGQGGLTMTWELDRIHLNEVGDYSTVEFDGGSGFHDIGKPWLPGKQLFIEVPLDSKPSLTLRDAVKEMTVLDKPVVPAQEPPIDTVGEENLQKRIVIDSSAYTSQRPYPEKVVEFSYDGNLRGRRLALVRINPIQYTASTKTLTVYKKLTVELKFGNYSSSLGMTDQAMEPISRALIANYQPALIEHRQGPNYLILTVSELETTAKRFAEWKATKGLAVAIEYLPVNSDPAAVKAVIKKYYPGIVYVLILADHEVIQLPKSPIAHPLGAKRLAMLGVEGNNVPSDLFYSTLEGEDYYPDIFIGRIPAGNIVEADLLVNKIINHQDKAPEGDWRRRFLLCGEFQYQSSKKNVAERLFTETAFTIFNSLKRLFVFPSQTIGTGSAGLGHAEYFFRLTADPKQLDKPGTYRSKIRDEFPPVINNKMPDYWVKNIVDEPIARKNTIDFWNQGAFLIQHRDHGGNDGWGKPMLKNADVKALTNGDKMPVLFSINCLTGALDGAADSFVEAALKNPQGGAASALAATRVSYSWWNDRLVDGFYTCIFGTGIYDCLDVGVKLPTDKPFSVRLGEILNFGKMYLALNYPSNPFGKKLDYTQIEFELFHTIGDPHMEIFPGN